MTLELTTPRMEAADRLAARIESRTVTCAVVGLGYIGTAIGEALAEGGLGVKGYDRSADAVERFRAGPASTRPELIADADVVHVAVSVPCAGRDVPDVEPLVAVASSLRDHPSAARLVMLHSTVPPGTTRWFADACRAPGHGHLFVAHCPERLQPGNSAWTIANTPHVVAGTDAAATRLAVELMRRVSADVTAASAPEVTELAKLMENAFIAVGVTLAAEFAELAHGLGVSGTEVADAAATKPFSYYGFRPGYGIGGHCIPNDLAMLASMRGDLGIDCPVIGTVERGLSRLPWQTVRRLGHVMAENGCDLDGAHVLLVGLGFKPGSSDLTNTPAREIVRRLHRAGAATSYVDAAVEAFEVDGVAVPRVAPELPAETRFDAALVLAGHPSVGWGELARAADIVLDAGGGRAMRHAPAGIERI